MKNKCPLCESKDIKLVKENTKRILYNCNKCKTMWTINK